MNRGTEVCAKRATETILSRNVNITNMCSLFHLLVLFYFISFILFHSTGGAGALFLHLHILILATFILYVVCDAHSENGFVCVLFALY